MNLLKHIVNNKTSVCDTFPCQFWARKVVPKLSTETASVKPISMLISSTKNAPESSTENDSAVPRLCVQTPTIFHTKPCTSFCVFLLIQTWRKRSIATLKLQTTLRLKTTSTSTHKEPCPYSCTRIHTCSLQSSAARTKAQHKSPNNAHHNLRHKPISKSASRNQHGNEHVFWIRGTISRCYAATLRHCKNSHLQTSRLQASAIRNTEMQNKQP